MTLFMTRFVTRFDKNDTFLYKNRLYKRVKKFPGSAYFPGFFVIYVCYREKLLTGIGLVTKSLKKPYFKGFLKFCDTICDTIFKIVTSWTLQVLFLLPLPSWNACILFS